MSDTRTAIIRAGMDLWRKGSEADVTARRIGRLVGKTHAGVLYGFPGGAEQMRAAIARAAVMCGDPVIIPKLITAGHAAVADMPAETRMRWLAGC